MPSVNRLCCGEASAGSTWAFTLYMYNCHYAIHPWNHLFWVTVDRDHMWGVSGEGAKNVGEARAKKKILFSLSTPITTILFRSAARACEERTTIARCLHAMHVYTEVSLSGRHSGPHQFVIFFSSLLRTARVSSVCLNYEWYLCTMSCFQQFI